MTIPILKIDITTELKLGIEDKIGLEQNSVNNQESNDKALSWEWQKNQFDLKNLTLGNISPSEFKTQGHVNAESNQDIRNDQLLAQEWQSNHLDLHNLTVGNISPSKFQTHGHINGESSRQNSVVHHHTSNEGE